MSEERFWNTDEYASTAKFSVPDGAMNMPVQLSKLVPYHS